MASPAVPERDGRQTRTERSRLAICEACLDLVQEGVLQPSADQVALRAGLSRRSIFNHFADLAELYDAVVEVGVQRCAPLLEEVSPQAPLGERVERLLHNRANFLEAASAFMRALTAQALVGPAADQALRVLREGGQRGAEEVERLLAHELEPLPARERADVLEAAATALSPVVWEYLRRTRGHSVARARAVVAQQLRSLLRGAGLEA